MIYKISNQFINFIFVDNKGININGLKKYLGNYINVEEYKENNLPNDTLIIIINDKNKLIYNSNLGIIDDHIFALKNNELCIYVDDNPKEIIFIKRLLCDLSNRLFEQKKGIFLHGASVIDNDHSIVLIGNKGTGKTTNMLNLLEKYNLGYSSNERTGIINFDGKLMSYGNLARINIRPKTLGDNESLKFKLMDCIDKEKYLEYSKLDLPMDCSERLVVTFDDISKKLDVPIVPTSNLYSICNLIYNPNINFEMEKIDYINIKKYLMDASIDGVFSQRQILNDILPINKINYDDLFNNSVNYYNIYQNNTCGNSDKIIKILRRDYNNGRR